MYLRRLALAAGLLWGGCPALAWDAHGHRTITLLAVDVLHEKVTPEARDGQLAFVFAPSGRAQAGYQSGEPDRYRAIRLGQLKHENEPDHYIDVEDLEQFGLTLDTVPPLRTEYLRAMIIAKHTHPENVKPYNERRDPARTQEWPGFLPHSITVHYGKLISSFRQVRVLEHLADPKRADQLAAARANVIFEMGQLSHFVGDAAQPLHTTSHHHGWVGDNPNGFTTNNGFHAYIDGTVLGIHQFNYEALKGKCTVAHPVNTNDPWADVLAHIQRSYDKVRPLYELQKSGDLEKEPGKAFIAERLCDGATMLGSLYAAAWEASAMTPKDATDFLRYDDPSKATPNPMEQRRRSEEPEPAPVSAPAPVPAAVPAAEPAKP